MMRLHIEIFVIGMIFVAIVTGEVYGVTAMNENDFLVEGNNRFAFELYSAIKSGADNLFFSPFSISSALAMTYAGARGETEEQMSKTLHFDPDQDKFHRRFKEVIHELGQDLEKSGIQLNTANALWIQKHYKLLEAFLDTVQENYGAESNLMDFVRESEKSRTRINDWVEEETQGKIKDLIKPGVLTALTRLVLTNAIYFKGKWEDEFDEELTHPAPFYPDEGSEIEALFMKQSERFNYYEDKAIQVIELPYVDNSLSMVILLPGGSLQELENSLSYRDYQKYISSLRRQEVDVFIPKFKMTSEFSLRSVLSRMGMREAFSNSADFSGMTGNKDLMISEVVHKAFVDVNEEGTEAAAATGVMMTLAAVEPEPKKIFRADHPFIFAIRDNNTGSILFMGRVQNPEYRDD